MNYLVQINAIFGWHPAIENALGGSVRSPQIVAQIKLDTLTKMEVHWPLNPVIVLILIHGVRAIDKNLEQGVGPHIK